ncbi:MAG: hypothetical protein GXP49_07735, partial [Deltaproteobacteria bacterium]|nr:hypothetical protein [Deltaproteobacteria bacterium]
MSVGLCSCDRRDFIEIRFDGSRENISESDASSDGGADSLEEDVDGDGILLEMGEIKRIEKSDDLSDSIDGYDIDVSETTCSKGVSEKGLIIKTDSDL